jgi:four helix bundle protein
MRADEFRERTMAFALRVLEVVDVLPNSAKGRNMAGQLCRSGTSVAANYRAACRAKSRADFIHKLGIVEEETDESIFWRENLAGSPSCALDRRGQRNSRPDRFLDQHRQT